jgi:glycosyltransferase involved in cell wall biosynthesis
MDQRVAVVIPAYNGSALLPETLDSIVGQTLPPAEIVVVDDGSPQSLDGCIRTYEPKGVRFLRMPNRGVNAARNTGAEVTNSPWLAFCDQDDIWLPRKLERQMELLNQAQDCQYCICDLRNFSTDGLAERSHFDFAPPGYWDVARRDYGPAGFVIDRNMFTDFLTFQPALPATALLGREFFKTMGGWNLETSKYCTNDFEFHLLCANQPPIAVVPEVLVHYRRHAGNWSADELKQDFGGVEILEYMLSRYEVARHHEGRLRKEIEQRTLECADRAFFEGRLDLFREYLGKVPLRRRPVRLIARDLLIRVLPEQAFRTVRTRVRTARSKFPA